MGCPFVTEQSCIAFLHIDKSENKKMLIREALIQSYYKVGLVRDDMKYDFSTRSEIQLYLLKIHGPLLTVERLHK